MAEDKSPNTPKSIAELKNSFADKYMGKNSGTVNTIRDLRKNGIKEGGKSAAEFASQKAIQAGLASVGVPPVLSKIIAKPLGKLALKGVKIYLIAGVSLFLTISLIIIGAIGFGGFGSPDIKKSELANDIPEPYFEAYNNYSQISGVPWTIYAALGKMQTDNGRISPYDNIIRNDKGFVEEDIATKRIKSRTGVPSSTPGTSYVGPSALNSVSKKIDGSVYKCVGGKCGPSPQIGLEMDEAKGPFLLLPSAYKNSGEPETLDGSLEIITDLLFTAMDKVSAARPAGYGQDKDTSILFWQEVLNEVTPYLGYPDNASTDCADMNTSESFYQRVSEIWSCEILKSRVYLLYDLVSNPDGSNSYLELGLNNQKTTLIDEALSVSYNYSQWDNSDCSSKNEITGIFPLSRQQEKKYSINRCDINQNIATAAKIVINGEKSSIASRSTTLGKYQPLTVGWTAITGALGDQSNQNLFYEQGPHLKQIFKHACIAYTDNWLTTIVKDNSIFANKSQKEIYAKLDNLITKSPTSPQNEKSCISNKKNLKIDTLVMLLSDELAIIHNTGTENFGLTEVDDANILTFIDYLATINTKVYSEPLYGKDSSVNRLSISNTFVNYPAPTEASVGYGNPIINAIITIAIEYGGLFDGDDGSGLSQGQPIGVTYLRDHTFSGTSPINKWSSNFEKLNFSTCGTPANSSFKSRSAVVAAWEPLCRAAEMAHVNLVITSAYRNNVEQIKLRKDRGDIAAMPATNLGGGFWSGGSPHEKGLAVDVNVGFANAQTVKALKFLHNIVGCYNEGSKQYTSFPEELDFLEYANGNTTRCPGAQVPINRANTYGFVFYCFKDAIPSGVALEPLNSSPVIECPKARDGGRWREMWHMQLGIPTQSTRLITDTTSPIRVIRNAFPVEVWDTAIAIARQTSGLESSFKAVKNTKHEDLVGLFGLPLNEDTKNAYLEISGDSGIEFTLLAERLLDPRTNANVAAQLWFNCDFGVFEKGYTLGYKKKCNNNTTFRKNMKKISDDLPVQVIYALNNFAKPYLADSKNEDSYDEISLIANAFNMPNLLNKTLRNIYDASTKIEKSNTVSGDLIVFATKNEIESIGIVFDVEKNLIIVADPKNGVSLIKNIKRYRNSTTIYYRRLN